MKLSEYFSDPELIQDADVEFTMLPTSAIPDSICYALTPNILKLAMGNKNITAIITTPQFASRISTTKGLVAVEDPRYTFYLLHNSLAEKGEGKMHIDHAISSTASIHPTAVVEPPVQIADNVSIGPYAIIYPNTIIGAGTHIAEGVTISTTGMQNTEINGKRFDLTYMGGVRIGENCQILTRTIIQRPYQAFFTEIGQGTLISVDVKIGHGSQIGREVMIAGGALLSGNCNIGDGVLIGPMAVLSDGIRVGPNANIKLGSVVISDVRADEQVSGNFALQHHAQVRKFIGEKRKFSNKK